MGIGALVDGLPATRTSTTQSSQRPGMASASTGAS